MKQYFTLLFLVFGSIRLSMAQDAFFRYEGKTLENDSWLEIGAQPDSFFPEVKNCMTNNPSDPSNGLFFVAPSSSPVSATMEILSNTLNPATVQWCMGGLCQMVMEGKPAEKTFTIGDDGRVAVEFDANGVGTGGQLEAKLIVMVGLQSFSLNIRFVGSHATSMECVVGSRNADSRSYDLLGRLCQPGYRGVTIRNGKKYINR
jgi:hypothetical protein